MNNTHVRRALNAAKRIWEMNQDPTTVSKTKKCNNNNISENYIFDKNSAQFFSKIKNSNLNHISGTQLGK